MPASQRPSLEERIQALEDKHAIHQLIMSYPLAVDSRSMDFVETAWTEDGVFDRGALDPKQHSGAFEGAYGLEAILKEVASPQLQAGREGGLCHIMTAPQIEIRGDEAAATGYTLMVVRDGDDFRLRRPTANRWDLVRSGDGWKIKRRTLRLLDGAADARELLGRGVQT